MLAWYARFPERIIYHKYICVSGTLIALDLYYQTLSHLTLYLKAGTSKTPEKSPVLS
jgi:hypothetical protein